MIQSSLLSTQKSGSCPAPERLELDVTLVWNGTSVQHLGKFLKGTPSIKEIVCSCLVEGYGNMSIEESLTEKLAEALCLNNHVHTL